MARPRPWPPQMYYSMRSRTLRRCASDLLARARGGLGLLTARCDAAQQRLQQAAAALEQAASDAAGACGSNGGSPEAAASLADLHRAVAAARARRASLTLALATAACASEEEASEAGQRLALELESAGNVRLHLGRPGVDGWVDSLESLLVDGQQTAAATAQRAAVAEPCRPRQQQQPPAQLRLVRALRGDGASGGRVTG